MCRSSCCWCSLGYFRRIAKSVQTLAFLFLRWSSLCTSHPFQCLISVLRPSSLKGNLNDWLTGERYREGQVSKCLLSTSAFVQSCQPWDKLSLNFHPHLHILISCTCKCWGFPLPYLGFHCSSVVGSGYPWFSLLFFYTSFERWEADGGLCTAGIITVFALVKKWFLFREVVGFLCVCLFACVFNDMVAYYFSLEPLDRLVHKHRFLRITSKASDYWPQIWSGRGFFLLQRRGSLVGSMRDKCRIKTLFRNCHMLCHP